MITDISITQEYSRNLLSEKPIPRYIQYFVKNPLVYTYTKRQIEVMKTLTKSRIYYYALTLQHPDYHIAPIPVAKMINSNQGAAEILK